MAYLKLDDARQLTFNDRIHFFAVSVVAIRHLAIDYMRKQNGLKHNDWIPLISIDKNQLKTYAPTINWIAIEQAISVFAY